MCRRGTTEFPIAHIIIASVRVHAIGTLAAIRSLVQVVVVVVVARRVGKLFRHGNGRQSPGSDLDRSACNTTATETPTRMPSPTSHCQSTFDLFGVGSYVICSMFGCRLFATCSQTLANGQCPIPMRPFIAHSRRRRRLRLYRSHRHRRSECKVRS